MIAEVESIVMAELSKVEAEVKVQTERIKQVEQQLEADVIAPAEAECQQKIAQARGEAASIIEDGKAEAEGKTQLALSWKAAGPSAKEIFLFQKLESLLKIIADSVPEVDINNVTVIDGSQGNNIPKIASFVEQLKETTGVDVTKIMGQLSSHTSKENGQASLVKLPEQKDIS
jgi:flotillin